MISTNHLIASVQETLSDWFQPLRHEIHREQYALQLALLFDHDELREKVHNQHFVSHSSSCPIVL